MIIIPYLDGLELEGNANLIPQDPLELDVCLQSLYIHHNCARSPILTGSSQKPEYFQSF